MTPTRGAEQAGRRPVLVLSHDVFNDRSGRRLATATPEETARVVDGLIEIIG